MLAFSSSQLPRIVTHRRKSSSQLPARARLWALAGSQLLLGGEGVPPSKPLDWIGSSPAGHPLRPAIRADTISRRAPREEAGVALRDPPSLLRRGLQKLTLRLGARARRPPNSHEVRETATPPGAKPPALLRHPSMPPPVALTRAHRPQIARCARSGGGRTGRAPPASELPHDDAEPAGEQRARSALRGAAVAGHGRERESACAAICISRMLSRNR